ncbi:hypothetical protein IV203_038482 [Nitzschia inconspicua]|uniref:Uncharacterized protein n=1 Tax=Nitzschia inconspicua TaxID=303405 RepID=A0A9K3Q1X3_9STRA|nr:hypothetical protein IV203_038482 [Nitzschia inconspicua]
MMIPRPFSILSVVVSTMLMATNSVNAHEGDPLATQAKNFQCGDSSTATAISTGNFTMVVAGAFCEGHHVCEFLVPKKIHWHIYPLPAGSTPKHSMHPEGLLEPRTRDDILSCDLQNIVEDPLGYHKGQNIHAGISLYIPIDQLSSISIQGVEQYVQVHMDDNETISAMMEPLRILNEAIDSQVLVSSPYWVVHYEERGVDNRIWMDVAAESSVDVSGVDIEANIKCPQGLNVRARGVDNDIFVEGPVASGRMDGVDADLQINDSSNNNPCANVTNSGVSNQCDETNDAFEMQDLSCLADTEAGYSCSWFWNISTAGEVAIGVGFTLIIAATIGGCIFCCVRGYCCCKNSGRNEQAYPPNPPAPFSPKDVQNDTFKGSDEANSVMEAEVLEIKSTTEEEGQFCEVDLEKAKGDKVSSTLY